MGDHVSDIVERLRNPEYEEYEGVSRMTGPMEMLMDEAADEIDRLRKELEMFQIMASRFADHVP